MASEYALNLKATLDTQQVQQELNRLKSTYLVGSEDGNSFSKGPAGSAHMQKIEVQLTKLNSVITNLQRSIEQLAKQQQRQSGTPNYTQAAGNAKSTGANLPIVAGKTAFQKAAEAEWLKSKTYRNFNKQMSAPYLQAVKAGFIRANSPLLPGLGTNEFAHNFVQSDLFQSATGFKASDYRKMYNQWYKEENAARSLKQQRAAARQTRQFAMLIGGQLLGGAGDIATSLGYEGLGRNIANIGEGITGGASAGMAATMARLSGKASGGIGIAVGIATVISKNIASMEQLAQSVNKATQAFEANYKALHTRTVGINDSIMGIRQQDRADQLLQSGNIVEARNQAKYWKDAADSAKETLLGMEDPSKAESRIRRLAERRKEAVDNALNGTNLEWTRSILGETLFKVLGQPGAETRIQEVKNQIDSDAQTQIADMQQRYKDAEDYMNRSKSYAGMYEEVVNKIEGDQQKSLQESNAEVAARIALAERNDTSIARYRAAGQVNATQAFANDVLGSKLTGPLEKFNKLSEELDKLRNLKNNSLMQAYGIAKDISENGSKMTSDDMKRELAKQGRFEQDAAFADQRIGIIENALASLQSNVLAPDLSHVTSLAQYGFNMGEKDDTVDRMDKYYSKSINLQQQIKDKLEQGVKTEAVYN